jgi:hypothetical protein
MQGPESRGVGSTDFGANAVLKRATWLSRVRNLVVASALPWLRHIHRPRSIGDLAKLIAGISTALGALLAAGSTIFLFGFAWWSLVAAIASYVVVSFLAAYAIGGTGPVAVTGLAVGILLAAVGVFFVGQACGLGNWSVLLALAALVILGGVVVATEEKAEPLPPHQTGGPASRGMQSVATQGPERRSEINDRETSVDVSYDRAGGSSGVISIFPDRIMVDGRTFTKNSISTVYAKTPDIVEEHARHRPQPPKGIIANLAFAAGAATKQRQVDEANRKEWSVWFDYGGKPHKMAWGLDQHRATALERRLSSLIFRD